ADEWPGGAGRTHTFGQSAANTSAECANEFAISVGLRYDTPMRKTYKYRVYLTNGQPRILNQHLQECRWVCEEIRTTLPGTLSFPKRRREARRGATHAKPGPP